MGTAKAPTVRRPRLTVVLTILFAAGGVLRAGPAGSAPQRAGSVSRNVLLLHSYHAGFGWTDALTKGFRSELTQDGRETVFHIEYLDSARFTDVAYRVELQRLLRTKYRSTDFDLAAVFDDAALAFLREHPDLVAVRHVVFAGINDERLTQGLDPKRVTGVLEVLGTVDMLELALMLHPGLKRGRGVGGDSKTAQTIRAEYAAHAERYRQLEFRFLDGELLSMAEIQWELRNAGRNAIGIVGGLNRDVRGAYYPYSVSLRMLAEASGAPLYTPASSELGQGILAGSENGGLRHGKQAGRLAMRILSGAAPETLPIERDAENRFLFDYAALKHWGIDERRLPANCLVVNRPFSFYWEHLRLIWGGGAFIALQSLVITALAISRKRRMRAEDALKREARRTEDANRSLEEVNRELRAEIEGRREAETRFHQAQKMEVVGQLAGGVAHDFNNLLTVIQGYAKLLATSQPGTPIQKGLDEISRASDRAAALTRQLLTMGRKQVLQPRRVNVNEIVSETTDLLRRLIGERQKLEVDLSGAAGEVWADPDQMVQVLMNLATNARDAMAPTGRLRVETGSAFLSAGQVPPEPGMQPGYWSTLTVRDDGHGIAPEMLPRVFEPYFTTKPRGKGTGLGLSSVYGIIRQSGGHVTVDSQVNVGTTFTVYLPFLSCGNTGSVTASAQERASDTLIA